MHDEDLATLLADAREQAHTVRAAARRHFWIEIIALLVVGLALGAASFLNRRDIDRLQEIVAPHDVEPPGR